MNPKIKDLIKSCDSCILSCKTAVESCQKCFKSCEGKACSTDTAKDCGVVCQRVIESTKKCMHECNQALTHALYDSSKQETALKSCVEVCKETIKRCQMTTQKILDQDLEGCEWPVDILNKCIAACDECIESFGG